MRLFVYCLSAALFAGICAAARADQTPTVQSDIVFVTQIPIPTDANNVASAFGNHRGNIESAPRGGDLYIRYSDGTLKNLTEAAGFGNAGLQGDNAIAVRDPCVHWSGEKVLFSMIVGAPRKGGPDNHVWQLYELSGLGKDDTAVITKISKQPAAFNNVMPVYGSDDRILFVSDRPRDGQAFLYPQHDEGTAVQANTGVWSLDPATGALALLDHAPSGAFKPFVDSFGRLLFTRWDHLQRDELADDTNLNGAFNYAGESANAARLHSKKEIFPEPRSVAQEIPNLNLLSFDRFSPWQMNQDGTELETVNHIGRHELENTFRRNFTDDPDLADFTVPQSAANQQRIRNFFDIREDPTAPGLLFGVDAPELDSHGAGQLITLTAAPNLTADVMTVQYLTAPSTDNITETPPADDTGLYRDPLPLSNGTLIASHTSFTGFDQNLGTQTSPRSSYDFRLQVIKPNGQYWSAQEMLTPGINKTISYFDTVVRTSYSGPLWELQPVEVRAVTPPPFTQPSLEAPEMQAFQQAGVDPAAFQDYLAAHDLAVIVSRNLTTRDIADRQQPFNLRVTGTNTETVGTAGKIYDVSYLQIFEGDLVRGYGGREFPLPGRRVLAQPLHDAAVTNPPTTAPAGGVTLGSDGSMAAFVPARRALTWQLTDESHNALVRERYWLSMQPGEIRLCTSCHGLNTQDQAGQPAPTNMPLALKNLLDFWSSGGADAGTPQFALSTSKKIFTARERTAIVISGLNNFAASRAVDIYLQVGGKSCDAPIAHTFTPGNGRVVLNGVMPRKAGLESLTGVPLRLELVHAGAKKAHTSARLFAARIPRTHSTVTRAQIQKICRAFEEFR